MVWTHEIWYMTNSASGALFFTKYVVCTCSTLCRAVISSVLMFSQRFWGYSIYFREGFWLVKSSIYQTILPIKKPAISLAFRKYFRYELQYWSPADKSGLEIYCVSLYCKHICLSRNILGPNVLQYDAILKKGPMNLNWVQQCRLPFPITLSCTSMIFGTYLSCICIVRIINRHEQGMILRQKKR